MISLRCFTLAFAVIQLTISELFCPSIKPSGTFYSAAHFVRLFYISYAAVTVIFDKLSYPFKCYISWPPPEEGELEICGEMVGPKRRLHIFLETSNSKNIPLKLEFVKYYGRVEASSREGKDWGNDIHADFPTDFKLDNGPFCVLLTEEDDKFIVRLRYNNSTHKVLEYQDRELGVPSTLKITKQFKITFAGMTE